MTSPIKDALQTLSRHSDVVEQGLSGTIAADSATDSAFAALRQASALRPVGEDAYRLHPRLREYLQDHLQFFPAFQSLAQISSLITQVSALWHEIDMMRRTADHETLINLVQSLETTIYDIVDSMEHNMSLLQTLMTTRFGNVRGLDAKKSQNRYYQTQTATLLADLGRLSKVCGTVEQEANTVGMEETALFLRRHLLSHCMPWKQAVAEMLTEIRKQLYSTREIERDHKLLARTDMMLRQQPTWRGFDPDFFGDIPVFLLAASMPALVAHVEPMEADRLILEEMLSIVRALPPKAQALPEEQAPKRHKYIRDTPKTKERTPAAKALERLSRQAKETNESFSVIEWRKHDADALTIRADIWLLFAVKGLRSYNVPVKLVHNTPDLGEHFSHTFKDALAHPEQMSLLSQVNAPVGAES